MKDDRSRSDITDHGDAPAKAEFVSGHRVPQIRESGLSAIHQVCGQAADKGDVVPCDRLRSDDLDYVVGEEKRIKEILTRDEVLPLLRALLASGACRAAVENDTGEVLWEEGGRRAGACALSRPLSLEGEPVGSCLVEGSCEQQGYLDGLVSLFAAVMNGLLASNLKRMLTTELHTAVVKKSYEELLETNRKLGASEARYRELSGQLEKKVEQRTRKIKDLHAQLLQQEKMAAIGQLAAGMAHEINNPLGFVSSNINSLRQYVDRLQQMLFGYRNAFVHGQPIGSEAGQELGAKWRKLKIDFILEDLRELFHQSEDGCGRIRAIVANLKGFAHIDEGEKAPVDLNRELDRTLSVIAGQLLPTAKVEKSYGRLPPLECHPARMSQVFLNILLNSVQSRPEGLELALVTKADAQGITITIADNGPGIPADLRDRVFEPFFTTKEIGKGKGLGLSAAYEIITSYRGKVTIGDRPGGGAEVTIFLPVKAA